MGPKDKGKTDKQEASYGRMDTETHHKIVSNRAEKNIWIHRISISIFTIRILKMR